MDFSGLLKRGRSCAHVLFAGCPGIPGTDEPSLSLVSASPSVLSLMTSTSEGSLSQAARVFGAASASHEFDAVLLRRKSMSEPPWLFIDGREWGGGDSGAF